MKKSSITFLLIHLAFLGFSQNFNFTPSLGISQETRIGYGVSGIYQRSIVKETLNQAESLRDINVGYPSSWIKSYDYVEISAIYNGEVRKAVGKNNKLNAKQIELLRKADFGTGIAIEVKYLPENALKEDDFKIMNFAFTVIPKTEAVYTRGYEMLRLYLKENAADKISKITTEKLEETNVMFVINEEGKAINVRMDKTSGNKEIDELLLQTINEMPEWKPAKNAKGMKVRQAFKFSIGYMVGGDGC